MKHESRRHRTAALVLAAAFTALVRSATAAPIGTEFQINTSTATEAFHASTAMADDGAFVVVWESTGLFGQDGAGYGILGRRFASSGDPIGEDFQVNTITVGDQKQPDAAMDSDGDFLVTWLSSPSEGFPPWRVFARRFSSTGAPIGEEFQLSLHTEDQNAGSVDIDADGDFVIAWDSAWPDSALGIVAQRYASDGAAIGAELQVSAYTVGRQFNPVVDMTRDGRWIATWSSEGQDGSFTGAFGQRFASDGQRIGGEFQVSVRTTGYQVNPAPALSESGSFVVVWTGATSPDLTGRRFSSSGTPLGGDFLVNLKTTNFQYNFEVAAEPSGHFVVTWGDRDLVDTIFAQRFSRQGTRVAAEFQVNVDTAISQRNPAIGMDPTTGDHVVAWWSSNGAPGLAIERGRRFAAPRLDVDDDAFANPLTDGVLVLRWLFGFRGDTLVAGSLGACGRCDPDEIDVYLTSIEDLLDADGSGDLTPLTDGMLVLRHLLGSTDDSLVEGAVDLDDCTRCDASDISGWIAGFGN